MREYARVARRAGLAVTALVALMVSACAVGPNYVRPRTPVAGQFDGLDPKVYTASEPAGSFWKEFDDPLLDRLITDALLANHDLRIALARVAQARADRGEARYDLFPTVTASGGYTHQQLPPAESFGAGLLDQRYYDAGFDASWELDLFGRVRREVQARTAQLESTEAGLRDAQVTVTAEVARSYFELRGEQSELDVAERNVTNQQATLDLTTAQLAAGRGTEFDTERAQAQLSATRATIPPLQAAVARSIHRLSVLTGRPPTALKPLLSAPQPMPPLPQLASVGNPATLLRRRPDIRTAERDLAAATAQIGVAVGDLFPKVTFTGNFGYAAAQPHSLGDLASRAYLIGPAISWPAFDLGRVRERIRATRAQADGALAAYEQTVLRALEDTENALVTHARARESLIETEQSARASAAAAAIARVRYSEGESNFLDVLDAERTELDAEEQLAQARTNAATSLIAVYKALGGGWEQAPLPRYTRAGGPPEDPSQSRNAP
jgi:outer membrane protein, multidrug efflux system